MVLTKIKYGIQRLFNSKRRSLRWSLAFYFIPISVIPTLVISTYTLQEFEGESEKALVSSIYLQHDAIVAELDSLSESFLERVRAHASRSVLKSALRSRNRNQIEEYVNTLETGSVFGVYLSNGSAFFQKASQSPQPIAYLSKASAMKTSLKGESLDRYFMPEGSGVVIVARCQIRDGNKVLGYIVEEKIINDNDLQLLANRRGISLVLYDRELKVRGKSLSMAAEKFEQIAGQAFQNGLLNSSSPVFLKLGDDRYAGVFFNLTTASNPKSKSWGRLGLFASLAMLDARVQRVRSVMIAMASALILFSIIFIVVFSRKLVMPIEVLIAAMRRFKSGRHEEIPSFDAPYEIDYLVQTFNDMTDDVVRGRKLLEGKVRELKTANDEIKNAQTNVVQSAKMASLGQLVAGVAHELNNPIGFIYSNMQILSKYAKSLQTVLGQYRAKLTKLSKEDCAAIREMELQNDVDYVLKDIESLAKSCLDGATRTKDIVLGLRAFSRSESEVMGLFNIHDCIDATLQILRVETKGRVEIKKKFRDLPSIECNASQMNQVFLNLLVNASQAIEGKGEIQIDTYVRGQNIEVKILDSGKGIGSDQVSRVFEPFYTTKPVGQGTGLGLSISYGIVQRHHGDIRVQSELGRGTEFTVILPISQPIDLKSTRNSA